MQMFRMLLVASLAIQLVSASGHATSADDEKLILQGIARWEEAWNEHDAGAGAKLFAEDADFVNVNASFWKGRKTIEEDHARLLAGMFKKSTFKTLDTSVRF